MTRSGRPDPKSVSPNSPGMTPPTRTYTSIAYQDVSIAARRDLLSSSPTRVVDYARVPHEVAEKAVISPLGFLGESSASAVVAELIDSMGEPQAETVYAQAEDNITEAMVHKGATVLYHLQSLETRLDDLQAQMRVEDGYILFPHAYQVFISDFRRYMRTVLKNVPQGQRLQHLSRLVWRNTFKPMNVSSDTTIEGWARQATGPNLRWETVGLLLSAFGLRVSGAVFSEDHVSHGAANTMSRIDLAKSMLKHVDDCIALCKICGSCSDLFAVLVYECSPLVEWVRGDVSAEAWVRFGEVCNTAVELGLHKEKHVDARTPFFLCELRIRLFAAIYVHDKYVSTYTGRPPRISYRHCVIQLPTDLSDDEVCSSQAELANALAKLNGGFANSGKLGRATIRRATMAHFIIREEILEIVLGTPQDDASNRIHQIRDKITHSVEEMPPFVRLDPEELLNNVRSGQSFEIPGRKVTWRPLDVCRVLTFHCNLKYTDFLLERALVRRSTVDPAMLVATARSLLNLVMKVTSNSSFLDGFHLYKVELVSYDPSSPVIYHSLTNSTARFLRHTTRRSPGYRALKA
jgi:hypothetical protein